MITFSPYVAMPRIPSPRFGSSGPGNELELFTSQRTQVGGELEIREVAAGIPITVDNLVKGLPNGVPLFVGKLASATELARVSYITPDIRKSLGLSAGTSTKQYAFIPNSTSRLFPNCPQDRLGQISRVHGYFTVEGEGSARQAFYTDGVPQGHGHRGSTNGSYVKRKDEDDFEKLKEGVKTPLKSGDMLAWVNPNIPGLQVTL